MAFSPQRGPAQRVRVVLSATALLSFVSVWKAAALAIAELGVAAFFVAGVSEPLGPLAPWLTVGMCAVAAFVRAIDIESWGLFVPGGLIGRARLAFGATGGRIAAATTLTERLLLAAVGCGVAAHYGAGLVVTREALAFAGGMAAEEFTVVLAIVLVGLLWIRARIGFDLDSDAIARGIWVGVVILAVVAVWGTATLVREKTLLDQFITPAVPAASIRTYLLALALVLPVVGGGDVLAHSAYELPPPRVDGLRRIGRLVVLYSFIAIAAGAFLFRGLVGAEGASWNEAPLLGVALSLAGPSWLRAAVAVAVAIAAFIILVPAARGAIGDAEQILRRLASEGSAPRALAEPHPRVGTFARAIDVAGGSAVAILLASGGRVDWLARAYGFAVGASLLVKIAALVRLRRTRPQSFTTSGDWEISGNRLPVGVMATAGLVALALIAALAAGDPPTIAAAGLTILLAVTIAPARREEERGLESDAADIELLPSVHALVAEADVRPGNMLVPVRNPHAVSHVTAAIRAGGDRDVVVMTARLIGIDTDDEDSASHGDLSPSERRLFAKIAALGEHHGRPIKLMIVPAHNVFDAVVATAIRLKSSDIYVGESATLPSADQARLVGEAWEEADKPEGLDVRLVIYHHSGRMDTYHLGAHPPALGPGDLDLIHRVWLDAKKAVGPYVHHHDVVRAALTQMEQQLSGPQRDEALAAIRRVARPADELASAVHARDFSRLRDMVRNRHAGDLAEILTELSLEDQVIAFRVLPRHAAADVFEYLPHEAQETLLKAMGQEEVAALLNEMAPDDRTSFLEELPAAATRQLLSLLTPAQRAVAVTLLGYPEDSIGRLMTPHYVAVREDWTIRQVLDYIREHGQDSETLNVVYIVDAQGLLIDDIRIRELLLTSPDAHVRDLMDRHFVALKATDDQQTAVAAFREYDRTALPVTDSAGMLIGIVTIDDVLDVAEATATKEIQRIGGSEALDEPYMDISFGKMIQKRAGWLTALFLGELLTATAMGAFEAEISKAVVLALFVPLIISSGGNSGSQASTLVIRALALGEVGLGDWWRVMRREILAGLSLGGILGSIGFFRITVWSAFSDIYGTHWLLVAITVAVSLVGIVLWGTLIGSLLPFLLRRLGFDPATSSAPFVATLVDVTGLVIYFSVALLFLRGTLL
jgi:magnesium transporter